MESLIQDVRYGLRVLLKSPGFAAVAVLSLALGMAVNTSIFSLINSVFLKPLPIEDQDRLMFVFDSGPDNPYGNHSYASYLDLRGQAEVFSGLMAYGGARPLALSDKDQTEQVYAEVVTGDYFSVLGVRVAQGRAFAAEEDRPADPQPIVVLSHRCWKQRFGADPAAIGQTLTLNGHVCTIIGVAPEGFTGTAGPSAVDMWVPVSLWAQMMREPGRVERGHNWLEVMGRLKPGVTREQAEAFLTTMARRAEQGDARKPGEAGKSGKETKIALAPVSEGDPRARKEMLSSGLPIAALAFLVGGLVLAIGCANVANLLLARAASRQKEIAVRLALGSSRRRLVRQLLTESVLLSLVAGLVGLLLALWTVDLLLGVKLPFPIPPLALDLKPDLRVFGFTLLLSVATGILFGLVPALQASKPDLVSALKEDEPAFGRGSRALSFRNLLVVSQVATSLVLLIAAGLFLRSFLNAHTIDPGFESENVLLLSLDSEQSGVNMPKAPGFKRQLLERVEALPGVASATLVDDVPLLFGGHYTSYLIEGSGGAAEHTIGSTAVAPRYFQTLGVALVGGRDFTKHDLESAPKVAIINETMARRFWPAEDPVGKRIRGQVRGEYEIVGVVKDTKNRSLGEAAEPWLYLAYFQYYKQADSDRATLLARVEGEPMALAPAVRREVKELNAAWPVFEFKTLSQSIDIQFFLPRMAASAFGVIGFLGLMLAAIGVYGVVAYSVSRRTREIGIRMALGARASDVVRLVVGQGMALIAAGVTIGLAIALAVSQFLSSLLYEISPADPLTFAAISLLLASVALLACYIPARRATKVDPMVALRHE